MLAGAYSRAAIYNAGNHLRSPEKVLRKVARRPGGWESWGRKGGRVAVGHVPYGLFREHLPEDTRYMTFLREPVDRVLSHYYRHIHRPDMSPAERRQRREGGRETAVSLDEALAEMRLPQVRNLATRFLCGDPTPDELAPSALDDAKANLRDFAFIGIQERFDESIVLLQRALGLELVPYLNRHVSQDRPRIDDLTDDQRALVAEHNQLDAELYRFGRELFEEALAASGQDVALEAETLRALSAEVNEEALQTARAWMDREFPPGTTREPSQLRLEAKEAGVKIPALKLVLRELGLMPEVDGEGNRTLTRSAGEGPPA